MTSLKLELKHNFKKDDTRTYDISELEIDVTIQPTALINMQGMAFRICLQEVDAHIYEDEDDMDPFEDYMVIPEDDAHGQQSRINAQLQLPLALDQEKTFSISVPLVSSRTKAPNFLDIVKGAQGKLFEKANLELYLECIVKLETGEAIQERENITISNPWG